MAPLVVSTVYVTEACVKASLACLAATRGGRLLYHFKDEAYERSSYCIGGAPEAVAESVVALTRDALARVDFRDFRGSHPTLGVMDHVAVNSLDAATIGTTDPAAVVRIAAPFDAGPATVDPAVGVATIGAVAHVLNFNVVLATGDAAVAKRISNAVRTRGGGPDALPHVEALALAHDGQYEVACNLTDVEVTPPAAVLERISRAAAAAGVAVDRSYHIGLTRAEIAAKLAA
ncbi:formimidoyltetrahydrofolate cyclodeaminase [Aureococcus anophagefferens]|nr:formimidoyltetrahydrofolate cyclodeaminase [Aureococcus anophagefferens]